MKRVISLYGAHDVGKTSTLRKLIELIATEQGVAVDLGKYDCKKTFTIDGKTVCICTAGDNKEEIWSATDYLTKHSFDIAVVACRCKGAPVDELTKYAKSLGISVEWRICPNTRDWPNDLRTDVQEATAKMLRRLI